MMKYSSTLATWWEELTHLKRPWCWERLKAGGEGDDRRWDVWMASLSQWTWVWVNSRSWWWTEKPGVLQSMGSQRVGHDWATELNWIGRPMEHNKSPEKWPFHTELIDYDKNHPTVQLACPGLFSKQHWVTWIFVLEWVTIPFSRGSSQSRDWTRVSCIGRQTLYH